MNQHQVNDLSHRFSHLFFLSAVFGMALPSLISIAGCDGDLKPILAPNSDAKTQDRSVVDVPQDVGVDAPLPDVIPDATPDTTSDMAPDTLTWCTSSAAQACKSEACQEYDNCATGEGVCSTGYCCEGTCTELPSTCEAINEQMCKTAECASYSECQVGDGVCDGEQNCCLGECI